MMVIEKDEPIVEELGRKLHNHFNIGAIHIGHHKYLHPWDAMPAPYRSAVKIAIKKMLDEGDIYTDDINEGTVQAVNGAIEDVRKELSEFQERLNEIKDLQFADLYEAVTRLENVVYDKLET